MSKPNVTPDEREAQLIDRVGTLPDVHLRMAFLLMLARAHTHYGDDLPGHALTFLESAVTRWASGKAHVQAVRFEHFDGARETVVVDRTCLCCGGCNSVETYHGLYGQDGQPLITTTCWRGCDAHGATLTPAGHVREWETGRYAAYRSA